MRIKKTIYIGIITLLTISGIINSCVSVLADENNTDISSSISSSQNSSASSSTNSEFSTSSSSTADSSSTDQATQTTIVASQDVADPSAPTSADGVKNASWGGLNILGFTILTGFTKQPELEQYVVANSNGIADVNLGFSVAYVGVWGGKNQFTETRWTWDNTNKKWIKSIGTPWNVNNGIISGTSARDIENTVHLPIGTYYMQYNANMKSSLISLFNDNYTSKLVKVKVVAAPIDATAIKPTVPKVIFSGANYSGSAVTTPIDSTGAINWTSTLGDKMTWNQQTGRSSSFTVKDGNQIKDVNTSTSDPGIKVGYTTNITTGYGANGIISGSTDNFLGGLVAKKMASDEGGVWSLDRQGLTILDKSVNPSDGTGVTWDYQWQYDDGSGFKNITASDGGVSNFKGTVKKASDMSYPANMLTFSKSSEFVNNAAVASAKGNDYVVKVAMTAHITDQSGNGQNQNVNINSNNASLTVTKALGKLSLDSVPDFNFGNVTTTDIYNGTSGKVKSDDAKLSVTDTRTSGSKYWILQASMSKMSDKSGSSLSSPIKITTNIPVQGSTTGSTRVLKDNGSSITIMNYANGSFTQSSVNGTLGMDSNHSVSILSGQKFSSNITWTLSGSTPSAAALK